MVNEFGDNFEKGHAEAMCEAAHSPPALMTLEEEEGQRKKWQNMTYLCQSTAAAPLRSPPPCQWPGPCFIFREGGGIGKAEGRLLPGRPGLGALPTPTARPLGRAAGAY